MPENEPPSTLRPPSPGLGASRRAEGRCRGPDAAGAAFWVPTLQGRVWGGQKFLSAKNVKTQQSYFSSLCLATAAGNQQGNKWKVIKIWGKKKIELLPECLLLKEPVCLMRSQVNRFQWKCWWRSEPWLSQAGIPTGPKCWGFSVLMSAVAGEGEGKLGSLKNLPGSCWAGKEKRRREEVNLGLILLWPHST